ncbi:MAG: hypothetical protein ABI183_00520, partial [Polyangiaceae bacterium]
MSDRTQSRLIFAILIACGPLFSIGACGGASDDSISIVQDDAAIDDVAIDTSTDDAALVADASRDASKTDAHADTGVPDAAKALNRCGGYSVLEIAGNTVNPGDSCGACNDGTIACVGSNVVECAGASLTPCSTSPVDAGANACGGYGALQFLSADAAIGDSCGECGQLECASSTSLVCVQSNYYCTTDAGLASACVIPSSAYTATSPSPTLPAEVRPSVTSLSGIALPGSGLAYNPYDGYLYASISPYVTSQGNSIAKIDPMSATVLATVYVGPSPTQISISDDGQALWVVLSGSSTIRRVDLTTFTASASFAMPPTTNVYGIQVLAGTENSVAVSSYQSYPYYGYALVIYDNGTPRPYGAPIQYSTMPIATPSASLLFAAYSYGYSVTTICADSDGAFLRGSGVTANYNPTPVFSRGLLYESDGNAYD